MPEEKYNSDELVPPTFLDKEFVVNMLESIEKDSELKLINHEIKPGSAAGDHYASIMFKIIANFEINGKPQQKRFVLKTVPDSGDKKDFLDKIPVFANEIKIYTTTLPYMEKLLNKFGETRVWPKLVYYSTDPIVLVFEDLTQENFNMHYLPLKMDSLKIVINKIAKYHAISMVVANSDRKDLVNGYQNIFDAEKMRNVFSSMIEQGKTLGGKVKEWPNMKKIGVKIETHMEQLFKQFADSYKRQNTWGFNVLNHGDFHIRNMMFKKDDQGNITDVTFLDYQIPTYHSPGFDLAYMLNCIADGEIRMKRFEMLKCYHSELVKYLTKFEFDGHVPSIIDVHVALMNVAAFDTFQAVTFSSILRMDLTGIELSELFNTNRESPLNAKLEKMYQDEGFIKDMTNCLLYFDGLGVFD